MYFKLFGLLLIAVLVIVVVAVGINRSFKNAEVKKTFDKNVVPTAATVSPTLSLTTVPDDGEICIQVITRAKNKKTGEEKDFPNPCSIPDGWEIMQSPTVSEPTRKSTSDYHPY